MIAMLDGDSDDDDSRQDLSLTASCCTSPFDDTAEDSVDRQTQGY